MGLMLVVGCGLMAFGPSLMLCVLVVGRRPALVIIAIVSAFFWLASMALASILWTLIPATQNLWVFTMITGVVVQGFGRVMLARVYMRVEAAVNEAHSAGGAAGAGDSRSDDGANARGGDAVGSRHQPHQADLKLNGISSSLAAGVGWGAIHTIVIVGTALFRHMGPGAAFSQSCPGMPSVLVSALSALPFVVLDLVLMMAAFAAVRSGDATLLRSTFVLHFLAALTTGLNFVENGCEVSLPLLFGVTVVSAIALRISRRFNSAMTSLGR